MDKPLSEFTIDELKQAEAETLVQILNINLQAIRAEIDKRAKPATGLKND